MRLIKRVVMHTFCTFSILSFLVGVLCKLGVILDIPYSQSVFVLFLMSICTTLFVSIRETVIPASNNFRGFIDITGCCAIIVLILYFAGWLEVSLSYFLFTFAMVTLVYLVVWLVTWIQSKHDEESLNRLLSKQVDRHSKGKGKE